MLHRTTIATVFTAGLKSAVAVAVALVACAAAGVARAGVITLPFNEVSESHTVEARVSVPDVGGPNTQGDLVTSTEPGNFTREMDFAVTGRSTQTGPPPTAESHVDQVFGFGQDFLFGQYVYQGSAVQNGLEPSSTLGRTSSATAFTVDRPWLFVHDGRARMRLDATGAVGRFHLGYTFTGVGPNGETEQFVNLNVPGTGAADLSEPLFAEGTLLPGWTYRITADLSGDVATSRFSPLTPFIDGQIDFHLSVRVPEPWGVPALGVPALLLGRRRRA